MDTKRYLITKIILVCVGAVTTLACCVLCAYSLFSKDTVSACVCGFLSFTTIMFHYTNYKDWVEKANKQTEYREYLIKELGSDNSKDSRSKTGTTEQEKKIEIDVRCEKRDIIALMLKNNDEITEYFTISKAQAKSSYRFSILSSVIGMIMIAIAIYGTVVIKNTEIAVIGVVSGSITEIIAGVVLWIHNKSAMQLNHYYDALHENEKFLSAINMADKLSEEKKEQMYIEIIKKQIEISNNRKDEKD